MDNQAGATYGEVQALVEGQPVRLRRHHQLLPGGEHDGPGGPCALRASGTVDLSLRKQL